MTIAPLNGPSDANAPPGVNARPLLPGQSGEQYTPNGLPALQPHGVDLKTLFSEEIKDPVDRIKRVENAVVELRHDFDAVLPSIVRLVAVEQDMQDLTKQLGVLLQNEPQAIAAAAPNGAGGAAMPLSPLGVTLPPSGSTTPPSPGPAAAPETVPNSAVAPLAPLNGAPSVAPAVAPSVTPSATPSATPAATPPATATPAGTLAPLAPLNGSDSAAAPGATASTPVTPLAPAASSTQNSSSALPPLSSPASTTPAVPQGLPSPSPAPASPATTGQALPAIAPPTPPAATVASGSVSGANALPQTQQPAGATVPAAVVPAPLPVPATPKANGKIGQGNGGAPGTVRDLRIGEHEDTHVTRLVIDAGSALTYTADLDNAEHLLVIDLPNAKWAGAMEQKLSDSPLVASWSVTTNAQGSHLVLQLKEPAKIVLQRTFPASGGELFKIVIDLAKP